MNDELLEGNVQQFFEEQFILLNLTSEDLDLIEDINKVINKYCDEIVDEFYSRVTLIPHLKKMIETFSSLEKLKNSFSNYFKKIFTKHLDENFINERTVIALTHFAIKLEPKWYIGAINHLHVLIHSYIYKEVADDQKAKKLCEIVTKLLSFEMQIVIEAYEKRALSTEEIDELMFELNDHKL